MQTCRVNPGYWSWMLVLSFVFSLSTGCRTGLQQAPPNVILILSDDAGYSDFGCYGNPEFATPNIDSLAVQGVRFTNAYVTASVCSPSRAGLLTGRYQQRFGHEFNLIEEDLGLPLAETTIADALRKEGYRTSLIGKWHLGRTEPYHPLRRGFDEFTGMLGGWRNYFPYQQESDEALRLARNGGFVEQPEPFEYFTDYLGAEAVRFIRQNRSRPFFLYLSFNAVHTPMEATVADLAEVEGIVDERRRTLAAMTRSLDRAVGSVLAALRTEGLYENTLIFFTNDNGGATNNASDNGPLRGMKGSKWEGGIRVPFLVQWPARLSGGAVYDSPIISLDILPTSLAAAGSEPEESRMLDGVNLLPFLEGNRDSIPHPTLYWRRGVAAAVRKGPWKAIRVEGGEPLLFNLEQDVGETTNLAVNEPERLAELLAELSEWERGTVVPLWREDVKWERFQLLKHRMAVVGREMERQFP